MSKFLIELPENEEIGDLVELMARFARANFRIVSTLETENEHLARGVAGLTGQILTPEPEQAVSMAQQPEAISSWSEFVATLEPAPVVMGVDYGAGPDQTVEIAYVPAQQPEPIVKTCEFCGSPVGHKRRICGKQECKSKLQKLYDAAWKSRRAATQAAQEQGGEVAAAAQETAEVAVEESPLAVKASQASENGVTYYLQSGPLMDIPMTFQEIQGMIRAGRLSEGSQVQAQPSGKFYEVRTGALAKVGGSVAGWAGDPGAAGTPLGS